MKCFRDLDPWNISFLRNTLTETVIINPINCDVSESLKNQIIWDDFRKGSKEALKLIYEENYSSLYHYGLKIAPDGDLVKDFIQDLFIELIDSGSRLSTTNNIRFYLLKALRNKLLSHLKKQLRHTKTDLNLSEFSFLDSIEKQLIKNEVEAELRQQVNNAIQKLSAKQQEIIYLRFFNDLSYEEIAALFKVEIQTVRNLMSRAIKTLKNDLYNGSGKSFILLILRFKI